MANERTLFAILENSADKSGLGWHKRVKSDVVLGTNEGPVLAFEDDDGRFTHGPVKIAGQAPDDAIPGLVALNNVGNLSYLTVDAAGKLVVTTQGGTKKRDEGNATGTPGSDVDVAILALTASKLYDTIEVVVAATQDTYWKLVSVNDVTETILAHFVTGAGQYTFGMKFENIEFNSGATGTQQLKIVGQQLSHGKATNLHALVTTVER